MKGDFGFWSATGGLDFGISGDSLGTLAVEISAGGDFWTPGFGFSSVVGGCEVSLVRSPDFSLVDGSLVMRAEALLINGRAASGLETFGF
jgi:hypothetical protein